MPNDTRLPDTAAKRAKSRQRSRRYRERLKLGLRMIAVELPSAELDDALIDRGFLAPERADDNEAVRAATEKFTWEAILNGATASRVTR